ncbi:MAG TPA: flagellar biosynthesis protein FlhA [Halanaerobiales bacterium]|nr:flagellar biosynthesis protein FlhA [Halanaerobiales bacterium]
MPSASNSSTLNKIFYNIDVLFAFAVVGIVIMFIIPMPTLIMDLLLTANITFSLLIILVSIYINEPLQVSVFPSLLLFATLFRLGLNVSTTRLILGQGYAGEVISSFGNFVVGGNYVVGFIIFLILVVIQYVVITKGAERVAEVAARFTLDAMPGKQMSIDADLNAGIIDEKDAQEQRKKIRQEADFYGAMDGASKFVKGDAIAGIIITVINIIGGLIIGMAQQGLSFGEAAQTYTLLTVGDGLVSQIPALLISTATGMIVTRAASERNMGEEMSSQMMSQPKALFIAAIVLSILGIMPGLPTIPFFVMAVIMGGLGFVINSTIQKSIEKEPEEREEPSPREVQQAKEQEIKNIIKVDQLEVEVGYNLISFVLPEQGGDFLDRVSMIRKQMAMELGIIIPPVRILDNLQLEPNLYRVKLKGVEISRYEILSDHYLAMDSGMTTEDIKGIETEEPAFGTPAIWIDENQKEKAEMANYTIVDPPSVMATHLTELIKEHAHELLGRQEVKELIDNVEENNSAVVNELLPDLLSLGEIQKVLQNLLWENIPVNNLVTILETLADYATTTNNIDLLTEYVRQGLSRQITNQFVDENNQLSVITLDPQLEENLGQAIEQSDQGNYLAVEPQQAQSLIESISSEAQKLLQQGKEPILVTSPMIRRPLKELTSRSFPQLTILSFSELTPNVNLEVLGTVVN